MLLAALPSKMDENWILHDIYNVDGCVREEWEWYCNDLCMREEWERDQERKEKEPEDVLSRPLGVDGTGSDMSSTCS